jgi:glycosyltransferase involved in cell wall biosynthesis
MSVPDLDILMITYNRPNYTRLSLTRLLQTCNQSMRVWIWHNGDDEETLDVVRGFSPHPQFHKLHHSRENRMLREPTNWFWQNAKGRYLSKVDDDCLAPPGWAQTLLRAHEDNERFGAIACWIFQEEDYRQELAARKLQTFGGGHRVLRNFWVGGSGYIMKRECREAGGLLRENDSFPAYLVRLALRGWVHGWYYPFLYMDHMDDPRSPNTAMRTDEDFQRQPSLSSLRFGTESLAAMRDRAKAAAIAVQEASIDPRDYSGVRLKLRRLKTRLFNRRRVARFDA